MGKLIDVDDFLKKVEKDRKHEIYMHSWTADMVLEKLNSWYVPPVEAIPKDEVRQFIESIQKIKDNHNEHGKPINYGTICGILIAGYRLLDKYMEDKDRNDDCN